MSSAMASWVWFGGKCSGWDGLKAALDSGSRTVGLVSWRNTFYLAHAIRSCSDTTTIYIYLCLRKTGLPQRWSLEMNKAYILTACSTVCHARRFLPYSASFIVSGLHIHIRTSLGGHLESHFVCTVRTALSPHSTERATRWDKDVKASCQFAAPALSSRKELGQRR